MQDESSGHVLKFEYTLPARGRWGEASPDNREHVFVQMLIAEHTLKGLSTHSMAVLQRNKALEDMVKDAPLFSIGGSYRMNPESCGWAPILLEMIPGRDGPSWKQSFGEEEPLEDVLFSGENISSCVSRIEALMQ